MFNFDKAISATQATLNDTSKLELLLMGPSGAGKSYTIGTLGVKTLYLYATRESHGGRTAKVQGGDNIVPICIDYGTWGDEKSARSFTADETLQFVKSVLTSYDWIRKSGFEAIALDGIAAMEVIVKESTEWKKKCLTAQGKHNTFRESEASQEMLGMLINLLKGCQRELGVHIIATAPLEIKDQDGFGGITEAMPRLQGYGVCESIVANFGDVLVVGKMSRNNEVRWRFQSLMDIKKVAKEENGTIKKVLNFSPRLSGIQLPATMEANLDLVVKMKRGDK
jgi:hypothetical protein